MEEPEHRLAEQTRPNERLAQPPAPKLEITTTATGTVDQG